MRSGEIYPESVEPGFVPTLVGLQGPAVDAARAAGVLVDPVPDLDLVAHQLLASRPSPVGNDS